MKHFYNALLLIIFLPLFTLAQSNYKPGYVVTLKGDTLHGFIDYQEWGSNPNSINFKATLTDNRSQSFTTVEINFFNVDKLESYRRYAGPVTMDVTDPNRISQGRDTSSKTAIIFLKLLQKGVRLTLYSYLDNIKTRFFIQESPDQMPEELVYRIYYDDKADNHVNVTENTYLKQFFALGQKYNIISDSFQWDIEHTGYNKPDILKITSEINGISKAEYKKQYNDKSILSPFAGVAFNVTSIAPFGRYQKSGAKSGTSLLPAISVGFNLPANPNTGKLIFRAELAASGNQYKSLTIPTGSPYVPVRYSYNQLWAAVEPQIIYNIYNTENFKLFVDVGLAITFYKYYNATYDINYAASVSSNNPLNFPSFFNTFSTPLLFKAGATFNKKFEIFIDYYNKESVSKDFYFNVNFDIMQIGVNYFLGK